jgi:hypothetical protein
MNCFLMVRAAHAQELETHLFEELEPVAILAKRGGGTGEDATPLEFLVAWSDGSEDTWEVRACVRVWCAACMSPACVCADAGVSSAAGAQRGGRCQRRL